MDYELARGIPPGWVNFSISRSAPHGAWQQLERGEIKMDGAFFAGFKHDLHDQARWQDFHSLALKQSRGGPNGVITAGGVDVKIPPLPDIDAEWLFWEMMRVSTTPDPWMFPALQKLKASRRFLLGALSNAYIFPPGHPYNERSENDVRSMFDVFISSAHVGLRKPDVKMYELAVRELDKHARAEADRMDASLRWKDGVQASDVLFLDDIGTNLKTAKSLGMRTIKVDLGKNLDAVRELEKVTGLSLVEHRSKAQL